MNVLVTGGTGLLGSELVRLAAQRDWQVTAPSHSEMDVVDLEACVRMIKSKSPDCVIHCAAFTEVDKAEADPEQAMLVNRDGSANVARAGVLAGSDIVHISTDTCSMAVRHLLTAVSYTHLTLPTIYSV